MLDQNDPQQAVVANYLRMIQDEAFRCKGITEKLLDFSRIGPGKRESTELGELVRGVIAMLGHLGKYQRKRIELAPCEPALVEVNPQEIKQVVLNLLSNALDSLDDGGLVSVRLDARDGYAVLSVADNGCGMAPDGAGTRLRAVLHPPPRRPGDGIGTVDHLSHHRRPRRRHRSRQPRRRPGIDVPSPPATGQIKKRRRWGRHSCLP